MIKRNRASIPRLIIHKIGNKFNDTRNAFSESPVVFDEDSYQLMLPYLHSEGVCRDRITLERLVEITASEPARFFGIEHRKGTLAPGFDADFVVLDDRETWNVRADALHNLNRYTPLEGRALTGRVRATYLRGRCVYQRRPDGTELFGSAGTGRFVQRGALGGR